MEFIPLFLILISISNICGNHEFEENGLIALIELEALALPISSYIYDPFLFYQKIDPQTHGTTYHWVQGRGLGPEVFRRASNDELEEVVVLHSGEDRLRSTQSKKTYVVLIRDKLNHRLYHPLFAYAR